MSRRLVWALPCLQVAFLIFVAGASALSPSEVAVVFNRSVPASEVLADAYMGLRGIPAEQKIALRLPGVEVTDRATYETRIAEPVRGQLAAWPHVRCLVTVFGVPLKVGDKGITPAEKKRRGQLKAEVARLEAEVAAAGDESLKKALKRARGKLTQAVRTQDKNASVDSELMLVKRLDVPTSFWVPNPLFVGYKGRGGRESGSDVLLVSRLDGPDPAMVRRIMADSVAVEAKGLTGVAYFDARWKASLDRPTGGYAIYDGSLHGGAQRLASMKFIKVVTDDTEALFPEGSCPNAALYCGWYSLATYVDAFVWQRGAVGYHMASSEMTTLKDPKSTIWCMKMLQKGVAATIGPVGEPYIQAFPYPEVFFSLLAQGRQTLVECYAASLPFLSWKMVLVGDPLYRPFYAKPMARFSGAQ